MSWEKVVALFANAAKTVVSGGLFILYGPFNYRDSAGNSHFTSASNAQFNQWLIDRDPLSGIRDFEAMDEQAKLNGFNLLEDNAMPANNRLLVWQRA